MINTLPIEYITGKFYEFAGYVKYNKSNNSYNGGCPSCREGKSWGKKARLHYIIDKNIIHCFNCTRTWNPITWIIENSGLSYKDILNESKDYEFTFEEISNIAIDKQTNNYTLPHDCINLLDPIQVKYYIDNDIVKKALKTIYDRRLLYAINKPKAFYISLTDFTHKNRLIIPFYDNNNNIVWYQSRSLNNDLPKYISKANSNKTLYGINNISSDIDYIFIFEGPIDAMFIQNGVSIAGLGINDSQREVLDSFKFHKKIWVLDNDIFTNKDVYNRARKLLDDGEILFIWPDKYHKIKDINELCIKYNKNKINHKFIVDNSYIGYNGLIKKAFKNDTYKIFGGLKNC